MSHFVPNNRHLREVLLFYFHSKKTAAEAHRKLQKVYGDAALSETTCRVWFRRFKDGDFDVDEGRPKTFEDAELEALLDEDQCQTPKELASALGVTRQAISKRLHAIFIKKQRELSCAPNTSSGYSKNMFEISSKCISFRAGLHQPNEKKQSEEQQDSIMTTTNAWSYILPNIFKYLEMKDLLSTAQVSTVWRKATAHPFLWKTVRLRYCKVSDWDGLANILQKRGTQKIDLRNVNNLVDLKTRYPEKAIIFISRITSLVNLKLSDCPFEIFEKFCNSCPHLKVLSAKWIDPIIIRNLECIGNLKQCQKLQIRLTYTPIRSFQTLSFTFLQELIHLKQLSLILFNESGTFNIDVIQTLTKLETLELGFFIYPENFGTNVLLKLKQLKRLRLEMFIPTSNTLKSISKLENLSHLELVNLQLNDDFKYLADCKNIKRLLITFRNLINKTLDLSLILESVEELSTTLTHFVMGVPCFINEFGISGDFTGHQINHNTEQVVRLSDWPKSDSEDEIRKDELHIFLSEEFMNHFLQKDCLLELQNIFSAILPATRVILIHMPLTRNDVWRLVLQRERRTK